jgi:hypothetical protein
MIPGCGHGVWMLNRPRTNAEIGKRFALVSALLEKPPMHVQAAHSRPIEHPLYGGRGSRIRRCPLNQRRRPIFSASEIENAGGSEAGTLRFPRNSLLEDKGNVN